MKAKTFRAFMNLFILCIIIGQLFQFNALASSYNGEIVYVSVELKNNDWFIYFTDFDDKFVFTLNDTLIYVPNVPGEKFIIMSLYDLKCVNTNLTNVSKFISNYTTDTLNIGDSLWINGSSVYDGGVNYTPTLTYLSRNGGYGGIRLIDDYNSSMRLFPSNSPVYKTPFNWGPIGALILIGIGIFFFGLFFYMRHNFGATSSKHLGGQFSIIFGVLSFIWIIFPWGFILGLLFGSSAIASGIGSGISGNERAFIGIGLAMFSFAFLLYLFSSIGF